MIVLTDVSNEESNFSDESGYANNLDGSDSSNSDLDDKASKSKEKDCEEVAPQEAFARASRRRCNSRRTTNDISIPTTSKKSKESSRKIMLKGSSSPGVALMVGLTVRLKIQKEKTVSDPAATSSVTPAVQSQFTAKQG